MNSSGSTSTEQKLSEMNETPKSEKIIDSDSSDDPFLPPPDLLYFKDDENPENEIPPLDSDVLFQSSSLFSSADDSLNESSSKPRTNSFIDEQPEKSRRSRLSSFLDENPEHARRIRLNSLIDDNPEQAKRMRLNSLIDDSSDPDRRIRLNSMMDEGSIDKFNEMQKAKRQPNYPSTIISVDSYFQDLYSRDLQAPSSPTQEELFAYVDPYSIEFYAQEHFQKQTLLSIIPETIEQLTTFSDKPLTRPLLKKIKSSQKSNVHKLSAAILTYIRVYNCGQFEKYNEEERRKNYENVLIFIIKMLRDDNSLVDECIMELIKVMRNTPTRASLLLAWKIFILVVYMFYITDPEIVNVIRWFLIHRVFNEAKERCAAVYSFICLHDRSIIGRNEKEARRTFVLQIPYCAFYGNQMFMCSLYEQVWNQRQKYPNLPIPLTLYLCVKALIKNGVLLTPYPFPSLNKIFQPSSSSSLNSDNNKPNQTPNNTDESSSNKATKIPYKKPKMSIVYEWINNLPRNNDIINDGEVCNLIAFLLEWLSNLLDPIIPKSFLNDFKELFSDGYNQSNLVKYNEFVEKLPLLHKNTLKYLIGFLREVGKNEELTHQPFQVIAENLGCFFVDTKYATVDPFTMKKICDVSPHFLFFCLNNLDVTDVYPLNPVYEIKL